MIEFNGYLTGISEKFFLKRRLYTHKELLLLA